MHEERPVPQHQLRAVYSTNVGGIPANSIAIGGAQAQGAKPAALRNCNTLLVLQMQLRGGKHSHETDMVQYIGPKAAADFPFLYSCRKFC